MENKESKKILGTVHMCRLILRACKFHGVHMHPDVFYWDDYEKTRNEVIEAIGMFPKGAKSLADVKGIGKTRANQICGWLMVEAPFDLTVNESTEKLINKLRKRGYEVIKVS